MLNNNDLVQTALAALDAEIAEAGRKRDALAARLREADRAKAFSRASPEALIAFLKSPALIMPIGKDDYEIAVPTCSGVQLGWVARTQGKYTVFRVNRFSQVLAPLPDWLRDDLGFAPPPFSAVLDGNLLTVTGGDVNAAIETIGGKAVAHRRGNIITLKPSLRFDALRAIIRQGFVPFAPKAIPAALLRPPLLTCDEKNRPTLSLRAHQQAAWEMVKGNSNILITSYPQTGKSFVPLYALASLKGKKAIAAPTRMLVEQWKARIAFYLTPEAAAEVVVATYQGLTKLRKEKFALLVGDEAHHVPADTALDIFYNLQADARIGLTATPFREDGQADLLPALFGLPVGADWPVSPSQKPAVTVWIVKDDAGKIRKTKDLCAAPVEGKTFVFTHLIRFGERLAAALDAPLVHGKTKNPRRVIEESDIVVVSRIANEGLSFPVRRVVEAGFWFGSNMEAGQRAGRMGYEIEGVKEAGEHHVLMTPAEYERYGKRLVVFYQWGLDVQIRVDDSGISLRPSAPVRARHANNKQTRIAPAPRQKHISDEHADDEIGQALSLPPIAAKLDRLLRQLHPKSATYLPAVFRLCWSAAFSPQEIAAGLGKRGASTEARYKAACRGWTSEGLMRADGKDKQGHERFAVDREEVKRLEALSKAVRQ